MGESFEVILQFSCSYRTHGQEERLWSELIQCSWLMKTNRNSLATTHSLWPGPVGHLLYTREQNSSVNLSAISSDFSKSSCSIFWKIRVTLPVCWCFLENLKFHSVNFHLLQVKSLHRRRLSRDVPVKIVDSFLETGDFSCSLYLFPNFSSGNLWSLSAQFTTFFIFHNCIFCLSWGGGWGNGSLGRNQC